MKKFFRQVASMVELCEVMQKREENSVREVLENLDKTDLRKRTINVWDTKFLELVPVLYKYDFALEFLDTHRAVCMTYFKELSYEDAQNVAFQLKLCKTERNKYNGVNYCYYANLLRVFLQNWDFCDEVKELIKNDPEKSPIVCFYNAHVNLLSGNREFL